MGSDKRYFRGRRRRLFLLAAVGALIAHAAGSVDAREPGAPAGWSVDLQSGVSHQADADIDDGGSFSVNRFYIEGGPGYTLGEGRRVGLSVGYGIDAYDFSGSGGLAALGPWDEVHALRFSLPVRWRLDRDWSLFASPTLRFTAESGADFDDAMTGGGFAGVSYRVGDRLTIGPGVGVLTQLEDSVRVIPMLMVDWKIAEGLFLSTGRSFGATLGPGLTLAWEPAPAWELSIGGRAESLRFRLHKDGKVPGGVGDDHAFPIFCGALYRFTPRVRAGIFGGVETGGELRLEDASGHTVTEQDHDPARFLGVSVSARF